jgi:hypothetical protein
MSISLEDRAAAAFKDPTTTAAAFDALMGETRAHMDSVDAARQDAMAAAIDPKALRAEKDEAAGRARLLELQLAGLEVLLRELLLWRDRRRDSEAQERLRKPWEEERRRRQELAAHGPEVEAAFALIARWLSEVREANHRGSLLPAPRDAEPLPIVEALARGIAVHEIGNGFTSVVGGTRFPPWRANSPAWPAASPHAGISPAVAPLLAGIAEADARVRQRWADMEVEAN